jgi:hypothetical protein
MIPIAICIQNAVGSEDAVQARFMPEVRVRDQW